MKSLKNIIKATLSKEPFDVIFWGQPTSETFNEAVSTYLSSGRNNKKHIEERAYGKLQKQKQAKTSLAILHLLDCLSAAGVPIALNAKTPEIELSTSGSQREIVADKGFYELYYKYLRLQTMRPGMFLVNSTKVDENLVNFCEMAEQSITIIIQMDFLLLHCLKQSKYAVLVKLIVGSILRRIREDLAFLNQFLCENWKLILRKHQFSFQINQIYEKTIFISKQIDRIKAIARKMDFNTEFSIYKLDPMVNKAIQMEMNRRQDERKQFFSHKVIKDCHTYSSHNQLPDIVSESSILIQNDEFFN